MDFGDLCKHCSISWIFEGGTLSQCRRASVILLAVTVWSVSVGIDGGFCGQLCHGPQLISAGIRK